MEWINQHIDIWLRILEDKQPSDKKVEALRTLVAKVKEEIDRPTECKYCGCTDERACLGGCSWVEPGICSQCVVDVGGAKEFIDSYSTDPHVTKIEVFAHTNDAKPGTVVLLKEG